MISGLLGYGIQLPDYDRWGIKDFGSARALSDDISRVMNWSRPPSLDLYREYKEVYDNTDYFDQLTGQIKYPGEHGDSNTNGFTDGKSHDIILMPGTLIDRYGSGPRGRYFSPAGSSFESRALPPYLKNESPTTYWVLKPFMVKSGEIAPWFGQPGGGIQYFTGYEIWDDEFNEWVEANVESLMGNGYIDEAR